MSSASTEKSTLPIDLIIIGGGLCGLACAIALRRVGHNVVLLERDEQIPLSGPDGGCRLPPNMIKVLGKWGLLDELQKRSGPAINGGSFYQINGEKYLGHYEYSDRLMQDCGGGYWLFVSYTDLRGLLYETAKKDGADIRTGCLVSSIDPVARTVTLANGDSLSADVIVAADGATGIGRSTFAGRTLKGSPGGHVLYHTSLPAELIPEVPEIKGGLDADPTVCVHYADGYCVYSYPKNPAGDLAIHIWGPEDGREEDGGWDSQSFVDVGDLIGSQAPWLAKLGTLVPPAVRIRSLEYEDVHDWMHADTERFIVVGEAAHPLPAGGLQNFAMLVEDAAVLGKLFSYLKSEDQIPNILWGFQDLRQARCREAKVMEVKRARVFSLKYGPEQVARDESFVRLIQQHVHEHDEALPYSLDEPRLFFSYDCDEAGADWWQSWGLLQEGARRPKPKSKEVEVGVQVEVEAEVN